MASTSEKGHAKNLFQFDDLLNYVAGYGTVYNPAKALIKASALTALATSARTALTNCNTALAAFTTAKNTRKLAFEPLNKLTTRVLSSIKASDTSSLTDESVNSLVRKMQGRRASAKKTDEEIAAAKAEGIETKEHSSSQMSFENRLENFDKLIKLLANTPAYAPNEEDLKVTALTTLYNNLRTTVTATAAAYAVLKNARIDRNEIFYSENTGLVAVAAEVKLYVKSIFGSSSPKFKEISKIRFVNYVNLD